LENNDLARYTNIDDFYLWVMASFCRAVTTLNFFATPFFCNSVAISDWPSWIGAKGIEASRGAGY